jgi:hypothetical protein
MNNVYPETIYNPNYGKAIFRRSIKLKKQEHLIIAGLEDTVHACKLYVHHDGKLITDVQAEWFRHPMKKCPESAAQLKKFIGQELTVERAKFRAYQDPKWQCTHLHDLLGLSVSHALGEANNRTYTIQIPDFNEGQTVAQVKLDGQVMHAWLINQSSIVEPAEMSGKPYLAGFGKWAATAFDGDFLEAAFVLQMGIFVSNSGRYDMQAMAKKYANIPIVAPGQLGTCFTFQAEHQKDSLPTHIIKDFSSTPDEMLKFLDD